MYLMFFVLTQNHKNSNKVVKVKKVIYLRRRARYIKSYMRRFMCYNNLDLYFGKLLI